MSEQASQLEQNRALMHRWFEEVWNQGRESAINEMFAAEGKTFGFPEPDSIDDLVGFKVLYRRLHNTFSEIDIKVEDVLCEGDKCCARWLATMTHTGDGFGIPPTGEVVEMVGMSFCQVRDGKILYAWDVYDITRVMSVLTRVSQIQLNAIHDAEVDGPVN